MLNRIGAILFIVHLGQAIIPPDTDIVRPIAQGDRLELSNFAGSVRISTWQEDRVRIQADHPAKEEILVEQRGNVTRVVPRTWSEGAETFRMELPDVGVARVKGKTPSSVAFDVRVPPWLPIVIEGPYTDVTIEGVQSAVDITVFSGDIQIRGARNRVSVRSFAGNVILEQAEGRLTVAGTRDSITVRNCSGDLQVETTSGQILLEELSTTNTEATSVAGSISYAGRLTDQGNYDFSTHSGDIRLQLPGDPNARFAIRAFRGKFETNLRVEASEEGGKLDFFTGSGSARVKLHSFAGTIEVYQQTD